VGLAVLEQDEGWDAANAELACRGGIGIVKLSKDPTGMLLCKRDIILGKNIPGY